MKKKEVIVNTLLKMLRQEVRKLEACGVEGSYILIRKSDVLDLLK